MLYTRCRMHIASQAVTDHLQYIDKKWTVRYNNMDGSEHMSKKILILHRILFAADIIILAASLVFYLIKWGSLPAEIGVHFDSDGNFNVVDSKFYGFYPHIIGSIFIVITAIADHLIQRNKTGLKITEKGEELFKAELIINLDLFLMLWSVVFAVWSYSVSMQVPLALNAISPAFTLLSCLIVIGIIIQIVTCVRYRIKDDSKPKSDLFHRLSRTVSLTLVLGNIAVFAECYPRHPAPIEVYHDLEYQGLAYFGNFHAYMDKRLLIIPLVLSFILLIMFELLTIKVNKSKNTPAVALCDRLKLISCVFIFWWHLLLQLEAAIGFVSVGICAALCLLSVLKYILDRHKLLKTA